MKVGDKVVCINDGNGFLLTDRRGLIRKDKIYTIYSVEYRNGGVEICVVEDIKHLYCSSRFRKVEPNINMELIKDVVKNPEYQEIKIPTESFTLDADF